MFYLSILMISNIYAESITIYATQSASYRASGSGSIDGQTWTWWNQGLNINQELPVSEVELGIDSGQLNVAVHEYNATIINSGLNAPRLIIEYELLDYECSEMDESACSNDTNCNWIENIETGNCDWLSTSECVSNPECLLDCVTTYDLSLPVQKILHYMMTENHLKLKL